MTSGSDDSDEPDRSSEKDAAPSRPTPPAPTPSGHGHGEVFPIKLRFLEELKRRNVVRVALLYAVVCWLILEPVHVIFHMLEVPVWANRLVLILMALGFPAVVIFAWVYEITPDGLKPTVEVAHHHSIRQHTGRRLDRAIIAVLALALMYLITDRFWRSKQVAEAERPAAPASQSAQVVGTAVSQRSVGQSTIAEKSIAVLPFVDMSEKKDQEYFGDGMAEDLIALLAKIPQLTVIGRTSSFQFKGRNTDLREIGDKLSAAYVVEGSVRKAGNRIRVTAQLIQSQSGIHVWADSFDRDVGDVLQLQDQIASSIARALQLTIEADQPHHSRALASTEAYTLYVRGRAAIDRGPEGWHEGQSDFEQALVLDPSFFQAAEAATVAYSLEVADSFVPGNIGWQHVREAAEQALRIDAGSAIAHAALGLLYGTYEYNWAAADAELNKALASHSRDATALEQIAWLTFSLGHKSDAERIENASLLLDPLNPNAYQDLALMLIYNGNFDGAELAARKSLEISPAFTENHLYVGESLLLRGRYEAALTEFQLLTPRDAKDLGLAMAHHALGRKTDSDAALARFTRDYGALFPQNVAQAHAYRGEIDQAFEWLEKAYAARRQILPMSIKGDPILTPVRGDPRYKALLSKMNLPE